MGVMFAGLGPRPASKHEALLPSLTDPACLPALVRTCTRPSVASLTTSKGMAEVKAAGRYRQEGKQYVVESGDIIHFQFNVTSKGKK